VLVVRRKKTFPREAKEQGNRFATVNRNILRVELRSIHRPLSRNQAGSGGLQRLHGQCQAGKPVQRAGFPLQADARRLCFLPTLFRSPTLRQVTLGGIMFAFAARPGDFQFSLLLAMALCFLMWPAASWAYSAEEQQACTGDAFRLCSAEIPDVDRVAACMARKQSQLSPGCRVYFRAGPPVAVGRPLSIRAHAHARKLRRHKRPA
jgi:hypothetical protein